MQSGAYVTCLHLPSQALATPLLPPFNLYQTHLSGSSGLDPHASSSQKPAQYSHPHCFQSSLFWELSQTGLCTVTDTLLSFGAAV